MFRTDVDVDAADVDAADSVQRVADVMLQSLDLILDHQFSAFELDDLQVVG
jgi:hypothetical protein